MFPEKTEGVYLRSHTCEGTLQRLRSLSRSSFYLARQHSCSCPAFNHKPLSVVKRAGIVDGMFLTAQTCGNQKRFGRDPVKRAGDDEALCGASTYKNYFRIPPLIHL